MNFQPKFRHFCRFVGQVNYFFRNFTTNDISRLYTLTFRVEAIYQPSGFALRFIYRLNSLVMVYNLYLKCVLLKCTWCSWFFFYLEERKGVEREILQWNIWREYQRGIWEANMRGEYERGIWEGNINSLLYHCLLSLFMAPHSPFIDRKCHQPFRQLILTGAVMCCVPKFNTT